MSKSKDFTESSLEILRELGKLSSKAAALIKVAFPAGNLVAAALKVASDVSCFMANRQFNQLFF